MKHQFSQKIIPRFQDADTEVRYVKDGFVRYTSNGRIARRGIKKGAWVNIKGTLLVPNRFLPSGINKNLGCCSNKAGTFLVFLNWNSNNESGIYLYNPALEEPLQLLMKDTNDNIILGFHQYFNIKGTKSAIINDKYFAWTDKYNAPRMIDIDWALDYKKKKVWEIQQVDTDITNFNVLNFKFNGNSVSLFTNNNGTLLLSNPKLYDYFDVEDCDCSITLTEKVWGTCDITTTATTLRIIPQNFYPTPHNERQIDLVCYPATTAPTVVLKKDLKLKRNLLKGNTWQFRTKIVYFDQNESAWSAWSKLINTSGGCEQEYNYIGIDYTDKIFDCFNDATQLHLIDKVIIGYRNTNKGNLHSFVTIKQCDIPKIKQTYDFYNDIYATVEPEYDDKIKQYDAVPLQCGTLNSANNRILTADVVENYDEGECFDFDVEVQYHPQKETKSFNGKISCSIFIRDIVSPVKSNRPIVQTTENANTYQFGIFPDTADALDQRLATPGFVVYLAGTDYVTISKQIIPPDSGLNIADADKGILKATTPAERSSIRDYVIANPLAIKQKAEFTGLKDGKYIIRIASHWCGYGNKLGKGSAYDLDNGLQWQKTSTNVYAVNTINNNLSADVSNHQYEAIVTVVNGVMQEPEPLFKIQDCSAAVSTGGSTENVLVQGYVIDNPSTNQTDLYGGVRIERAAVKTVRTREVTGAETSDKAYTITDHNGYFYAFTWVAKFAALGNNKILVAKDRDANFNVISGGDGDMAILWNGDNPYRGNLSDLANGSCDTFDNSGTGDNFHRGGVVDNFIVPYLADSHNVTNNFRTEIKGRLVNADGYPIPGILVLANETDRFDKTDNEGRFGIIVYSNSKTKCDERKVKLIFSGDSCNDINFSADYTIDLGKLPKYNNTHPYDIGDITVDITYNDLTPQYYLKNGDTYDIGVTLMDRALRKTTVIHNDKKHRIKLPFTTERIRDYFPAMTTDVDGGTINNDTKADGFFTFKLKTVTAPPVWSTHLYLLRTEGQVYSDYLQMTVSDIKYVINYHETANIDTGVLEPDPVTTTYANKDANEIYLDLTSSFQAYKDENSDSLKGWTFEKGDRLRFLYKTDGGLYDFIEAEIKEQRGNYFVIDNLDALDELKKGIVVELFRLKTKVTNKNYYEIAEHIKVLNPYTDGRAWETAYITPNTGDAYRRIRKMIAKTADDKVIVSRWIEDLTPDDTVLEKDNDRGRLDFINDFYKQVRRQATIRFGDDILLDSNLNNIRRFNAEQQVTADYNNGAINIIDNFDNLLFVAQESKCHTRLIGKTTAYLGDGQQLQFDANSFLAKPYYLNDMVGCQNPESYAVVDNSGIFFDSSGGIVVKYSPQNGLTNISGYDEQYKTSKYQESIFIPLSQKLNLIPKDLYNFISQVNGMYNDFEKEYNIGVLPVNIQQGDDISAFSGTRLNSNIGENDAKFKVYTLSPFSLNIDGFTIANDTESGYWFGFRSYNPETYGTLKNRYFGFKNGVMHEMEKGDKYTNFFGVQEEQSIWVMMNINPSDMKFYTNWSVESNEKWSNPYVKIDNSRAFRLIESRTPDASIIKQNGVFYSAFCFDTNTPNVINPLINGNKLCGETLIMHLKNNKDTEVVLFAVNIYAGLIHRTNF